MAPTVTRCEGILQQQLKGLTLKKTPAKGQEMRRRQLHIDHDKIAGEERLTQGIKSHF